MADEDGVSDATKREWMGGYGLITFGMALLLFGIRYLLLRDAAHSRISKAAEYVPVVEVRVPCCCPSLRLCLEVFGMNVFVDGWGAGFANVCA